MGKTALIAVDVQVDFLPGGKLPVPDGDEVIEPLTRLAAAIDGPVVASMDWHPESHCSFDQWPSHCVADTLGAQLATRIAAVADARFFKGTEINQDSYSAFGGTTYAGHGERLGLKAWLEARGVTRVVIGGLATDFCVAATAHDALAAGFEVSLVPEAMRGLDPEESANKIAELVDAGATIEHLEELA